MSKKLSRKQFIQLATLGSIGLYLSCNTNTAKKQETAKAPAAPAKLPERIKPKDANVVYYKKGEAHYDELRAGFNKRIDKYPAVVALCYNTEGVAEAIQYAKENNLPVAIKSGGHCMEGLSVNNDGIVINLSELNNVKWEDDKIVSIGPGLKLEDLYNELLPKKRIIPAGSCGGVGIGGLALGGGYGLFARKYGLTCDSLLELTMVDGNGKIHNTKDDEELLWACRGGGNGNFGVITEMKFTTYPAPTSLQSHRFKAHKLDADRAYSLLENWFITTQSLPDTAFSGFVLNGKTLTILVTDTKTLNPKIIMEFTAITDKAQPEKPKPLNKAVQVFYGLQEPTYFKNSSVGFYKGFDDIKSFIKQALEKVITTPGMIYQVNTLGGKIQDAEFEKASAYAHRAYPYLSELQTYWEKPTQGERLEKAFDEVQDIFIDNGIKTEYCNYASLRFKNWEEEYYGSNYKRLQAIKSKYDPDNIIRREQGIKG